MKNPNLKLNPNAKAAGPKKVKAKGKKELPKRKVDKGAKVEKLNSEEDGDAETDKSVSDSDDEIKGRDLNEDGAESSSSRDENGEENVKKKKRVRGNISQPDMSTDPLSDTMQ